MSFPFRCTECKKLRYSKKVTQEPEKCCKNGKFQQLTNIHLLLPANEDETPIHTSSEYQGLNSNRTSWVVACGLTKLPSNHTDQIIATTCEDCLKEAHSRLKDSPWISKNVDPSSLPEVFSGTLSPDKEEDFQYVEEDEDSDIQVTIENETE